MKIASVYCGQHSTAEFMIDGAIKPVVSQEKIDNIKNSGGFPLGALTAILEKYEIDPDEQDAFNIRTTSIDDVALGL